MAAAIKKAKSKKRPLTKDDLRRLMKTKRTEALTKVEHPCAKYNTLGQLLCIVCNSQIKNDKLWTAHLMGRTHKENVETLKKSKLAGPEQPGKRRASHDVINGDGCKRVKASPSLSLKSGINRLGNYSSSDEESDGDNCEPSQHHPQPVSGSSSTSNNLPSDFFDSNVEPGTSNVGPGTSHVEPGTSHEEAKAASMADTLPEGFFDNPREDAKVRQVEFKDKMDEEWELFQRAMKEEKNVSEAIIEVDDEVNTEDRNIKEIDDQMHRWSKIQALADKKDKIMQETAVKMDNSNTEPDSDLEEQEFDEFLDWRSKSAWKS